MTSPREWREESEIADPDTAGILRNIADMDVRDAEVVAWLKKVADELVVISLLLDIAEAAGRYKETHDSNEDGLDAELALYEALDRLEATSPEDLIAGGMQLRHKIEGWTDDPAEWSSEATAIVGDLRDKGWLLCAPGEGNIDGKRVRLEQQPGAWVTQSQRQVDQRVADDIAERAARVAQDIRDEAVHDALVVTREETDEIMGELRAERDEFHRRWLEWETCDDPDDLLAQKLRRELEVAHGLIRKLADAAPDWPRFTMPEAALLAKLNEEAT